MKVSKIAKRTLLKMTLLALVLIVGICAAIGSLFLRQTLQTYSTFAFSYTRMAADVIDGDTVLRYVETGEKDSYYDRITLLLETVAKHSSLRYFYVVIPQENGLLYIWDAQPNHTARELLNVWEYSGTYPREEAERAYRNGAEQYGMYRYKDMDLATAISPLKNSAGETVAIIAADMLMPNIRTSFWGLLANVALYICLIMLVAMAFSYYSIRKGVITPLLKLQTTVTGLVDNLERESVQLDIKTGDEIEMLARSVEKMDKKLRNYISENLTITAENERIGTELSLATRIQFDMMPNVFPHFSGNEHYSIDALMHPAKEVGGDFYDFFMIDDDHLALVTADVSGKGVGAALFMMIAKTLIKNEAIHGDAPAEVLRRVNEQLSENNEEGMFVTVWLGVLELSTLRLNYADAGHEKMLLYHDGSWRYIEKPRRSAALAMLPEEMIDQMPQLPFVEGALQLSPGDVLFEYTDGVTEAVNADAELFGEERLLSTLQRAPSLEPTQLLPFLRGEVDAFVDGAPQFDDITMLAIRLNDPDKQQRDRIEEDEKYEHQDGQ